jgi:hypothetical protein
MPQHLLQLLQQATFFLCEVALCSERTQHATVGFQFQVSQNPPTLVPREIEQQRPTAGAHLRLITPKRKKEKKFKKERFKRQPFWEVTREYA